jgi:hypothetical protein
MRRNKGAGHHRRQRPAHPATPGPTGSGALTASPSAPGALLRQLLLCVRLWPRRGSNSGASGKSAAPSGGGGGVARGGGTGQTDGERVTRDAPRRRGGGGVFTAGGAPG